MNHTLARKENPRAVFLWLLSLAFITLLVCQGNTLSRAAYDSLVFAATKLVPSMFLFAIATGIVSALPSGRSDKKIPLLKLPLPALPSLLIGLFSGFPMGAYAAKRLLDEGALTQKEAEHLASFSNNVSFAFLYFTVGELLKSQRAGLLLFVSGTLSSLIVGAVLSPKNIKTIQKSTPKSDISIVAVISSAITSAVNAMLVLCGYLTLFGTLAKGLTLFSLPTKVYTALLLFLEPSAAVRHLATLEGSTLPLFAFALGFSGFSILLQSLALWQGKLSFSRLFFTRLLIGSLSAIITALLCAII